MQLTLLQCDANHFLLHLSTASECAAHPVLFSASAGSAHPNTGRRRPQPAQCGGACGVQRSERAWLPRGGQSGSCTALKYSIFLSNHKATISDCVFVQPLILPLEIANFGASVVCARRTKLRKASSTDPRALRRHHRACDGEVSGDPKTL